MIRDNCHIVYSQIRRIVKEKLPIDQIMDEKEKKYKRGKPNVGKKDWLVCSIPKIIILLGSSPVRLFWEASGFMSRSKK